MRLTFGENNVIPKIKWRQRIVLVDHVRSGDVSVLRKKKRAESVKGDSLMALVNKP